MVTKDQIRAMALRVSARCSRDQGVREAARRREEALGAAPVPAVGAPAGKTASRALHEARVAVESSACDPERARGMLGVVLAEASYESDAHVVLAAAYVREARRQRAAGDAEGASRSAMAAFSELSEALAADPGNDEGLVLLDELDALTGYADLTLELRRAMRR